MGAIVAIIGGPEDPELPVLLDRMLARSPYRGEPERHVDGGLALGVQSLGWDASLATLGNWTVAIHGIINNWAELAPVHGWRFPSDASSALKLAIAYDDLGDALFRELRGPFAIVIHDRRNKSITVARDIWAERPLYFESKRRRLYLATEIRQILAASGSSIEIDDDVLLQNMLWRPTFPDRTHIQCVSRVEGGHVHRFDTPPSSPPTLIRPVWEPPEQADGPYNADELAEELGTLLERVVARWLIGVPFVLALSGGVDSATIWSAIVDRARAGDHRARLGKAISISLPGDPNDETNQIKRIAEATGTHTHFVEYSPELRFEAMIRNAPMVDCPVYEVYSDCPTFGEAALSDGRRLMLSGFGGGIHLAGSFGYLREYAAEGRILEVLRDLLFIEDKHLRLITIAVARRVRSFIGSWITAPTGTASRKPPRLWMHPSRFEQADLKRDGNGTFSPAAGMDRHRATVLSTLQMYHSLAAQEANEQFGAARGFVYGSPLVDVDLLDFSLRVPPRALTDGKRTKRLFRMAAYNRLSRPIRNWRNRSADMFFEKDEIDLMRKCFPPREWCLKNLEIIDVDYVEAMFAKASLDSPSASQLIEIISTEAIIRNLTCPGLGDVAECMRSR